MFRTVSTWQVLDQKRIERRVWLDMMRNADQSDWFGATKVRDMAPELERLDREIAELEGTQRRLYPDDLASAQKPAHE